jgi:hypothetical protein
MDDLKTLINRRFKEELKISGQLAVDQAREAGYKITNQRLSQLVSSKPITQVPYPDTLKALAFMLDVPIEEVCDAALRSTGVPIPVRMNADGRGPSLSSDGDDSATPSSEAPEMTLVLRVEGLSPKSLHELIQTVAETALREGQNIAHSGQSRTTPTPI